MIWQPSNTPEDVLMHYAKGSRAKKHKYIAIKNGRYIYPEDKITTAAKTYQEAGKKRTERENIDAAIDWRRNAPSSNRAMLTAREAQKQGFKRTVIEKDKEFEALGFKPSTSEFSEKAARDAAKYFARRDLAQKKAARETARVAQAQGYKRTQYEKAINDSTNKYLLNSTNRGDRLEAQRRIAIAKGEYETASKLDKQVSAADRAYRKMANADYRSSGGSHAPGYTKKPINGTIKRAPVNKTAKKNQTKAKISAVKYKAKRITKQAISKGKSLYSSIIGKFKKK